MNKACVRTKRQLYTCFNC